MPDDQTEAVETTTATTTDATGKDGTAFDPARAQSTIETLRASENELKKQLKDGGKKLTDLESRLAAFEDKDKTEVERAASERDQAKQKLTETETRLRSMAVRVAVAETATAAGIAPENVKAAIRLLDISAIEMDEDGEPKNVEAVLKQLVKDFPILAPQTTTSNGGTATKSTPATPKAAGAPNREDRVKQAEQELAASRRYTL